MSFLIALFCNSTPRLADPRQSSRTARALKIAALVGMSLYGDRAFAQDLSPGPLECPPSPGECCCCPSISDQTLCGPQTLFQWCGGDVVDEAATRGPLSTDRPDFTESATTVGRGIRQLEMGYTYAYDDEGGVSSVGHSYPEALFRFSAFAEWLEFRVAYNYGSLREGGNPTVAGSEDLYLGAKVWLAPQCGILPSVVIMPQMTVPTGSQAFTADKVLPGVNLLYAWDISEFLSMAGSTQVNAAVDDTGSDYAEFAQSWTIGYGLSEKVGAFTEWYVLVPSGADTARTEHYLDAGFTYLVSDDLQLDIRIGKGVSGAATDYFAGSGLSVRF